MALLKVGTKLKAKVTGALAEIVDLNFNCYEWSYTVDTFGIKKEYSHDHLLKEFDIVEGSSFLQQNSSKCECGGEKTFGSRDKVYHSFWCFYGK